MSRVPEIYIDTSANIQVDEVSSSTTYVGYADVGILTSEPKWMIKKLSSTSTTLGVTYAEGNAYFNKIWDNRSSYTYS